MFLFKDSAAQLENLSRNFFGSTENGGPRTIVWLMEGDKPNSVDDIPFDITNPIEVSSNARGWAFLNMPKDVDALSIDGELPTTNSGCVSMLTTPYQDSTRNDLYRVFPKYSCYDVQVDGIAAGGDNRYAKVNGLRYVASWAPILWRNPDAFEAGNTDPQFYISPNRRHYNYPSIIEFEEEVSIAHVAIQQSHSGNPYTNTNFTLEPWDETLNAGAGGWGSAVNVTYSQSNSKNEVTLSTEVVGTKFRLKGGDTGSQDWICKYISFYSSIEPSNLNETVSLGWGIVMPYWYGLLNLGNGSDWDTNLTLSGEYPANDTLPLMICSVGDYSKGGVFVLESATNLSGKTDLEFSAFSLTYGE